jgi:hypothetical protein
MYTEKYTGLYKYISQQGIFQPTKHYLFTTWRMMNVRCYDSRHKAYHRYGARGISVCKEWRWDNPYAFITFLRDVGERPKGVTLDRIDNNCLYTKDNCKWSDKRLQQNNMGLGLTNTSGSVGVHLSNNSWVVQITLNGNNHFVGVFNLDSYDLAGERYKLVKQVKMEKGDTAAIAFVDQLDIKTPTNKRLRRNKSSKYYGVHLCIRTGLWLATTTYRLEKSSPLINVNLGRHKTQEGAYDAVLKFIEWVDKNGFYKKKN